jgi:simple sugar transport system ATP-binding protein
VKNNHVEKADYRHGLEIRNISKRFGKIQALDDISIFFRRKEIHALVGENGAGKSTLMNIIYGLYQKERGEILINGEIQEIKSTEDSLRLGIGMVPQYFKLVRDMNILENVFLFMAEGRTFFINRGKIKDQIIRLSKMFSFGLENKLNAAVGILTEGEKQKVEIIKVLARGSKILLFDEATNVLAQNEVDAFLKVIKELNKKGCTIIYITHRLQEALTISDRISVMRKGRLVGTIDKREASYQTLTAMMVGKEIDQQSIVFGKKNIAQKKLEGKKKEIVLQVEKLNALDKRGLHVIQDISFDLFGGEIFGLAGVDGNGSRELAEAIMGLLPALSGKVKYKDEDITKLKPGDRMKRGLSFMPGSHTLVEFFDVRSNTILDYPTQPPFSKNGILNGHAITAHAKNVVDSYEVQTASILLEARKLSGGNRQRLALGRKIEVHPECMIAYHPTKGLDFKCQNFIYEKFLAMKDSGAAIFFLGTDLDEILLISDRLMVIHRGRIVGNFDDISNLSKFEVGMLMTGGKSYLEEGELAP